MLVCTDDCPRCPKTKPRTAYRGKVKLKNGLVIPWLQFAESAKEAVRIVTAQSVHVEWCRVEG